MGNSGANQTWSNASGNLFTVGGAVTGTATVGNTQALTLANTGAGGTTVTGAVSDVSGGGQVALTINNSGAGVTTLAGVNTYTGATTLSAGAVNLTGTLGSAGGTAISSAATFTESIAGVIAGGSSLAVSAGVTTLGGTNTYTGGTTLTLGSIVLGNVAGLSTGFLTVNGGQLDLAGFNPTITTLNGSGGAITNSGAGATLTVNAGSYAGAISDGAGTIALTIATSGTVTLSGANAYSGNTTISSGTLRIGGAGQLGSGSYAGTIANSGTLQYSSSAAQTLSGAINGAGALIKDTAASTLTLSASNSYMGGTTLSAGSIALGNAGGLSTGVVTVNGGQLDLAGFNPTITTLNGSGGTVANSGANAVLTVNNGAYGGTINNAAGTIALSKATSGTLILTGANSYSGGTTITAGTLQLGNGAVNGTFGSGAYSIASNATLLLNDLTSVAPTWTNISGAGTLSLKTAGTGTGTGDWGQSNLGAGFTGAIVIQSGRVYNTTASQLGGATSLTVQSGGQFLAAFGVANAVYNLPMTIAGAGYGETADPYALRYANAGFADTFSGPVTLSANAAIGGSGTVTFSNAISGASTAFLNFYGGTAILSGANTYTGQTIVSSGTLSVTGSLGATQLFAGYNSGDNGTLTINTSATVALPILVAGQSAGAVGTVNMNGGTLNFSSFFDIGNSGTTLTSTYNQTAGAVTVSGLTYIGNGGQANFTISGGTFTATGGAKFNVAASGSPTSSLNLNGGTFTVGAIQTGGGTSNLNFGGGTLAASANSGSFLAGLTAAKVNAGGGTIDNGGHVITITQPLVHGTGTPDGGLAFQGVGTTVLAQTNTYTGPTTIGNGTLRLGQVPTGLSTAAQNSLSVQLDASNMATGAITTWGNPLSAGNFTGNGTVQSGISGFNGKNVVNFNGSQVLTNANAGVGLASSETIFYVGALNGTASTDKRLVGGASTNWLLGYWNDKQDTAYGGTAFFGAGGTSATVPATSATHMYELVDSANALTLYSSGTSLGTGTATVSLQGVSLGGSNGENSPGYLGEVLVFNSALSTADRQAVEAYLNYKWFGVGPASTQSNLLPTASAVSITGTGTLDLNGVNQTIGSLASATSSFVTLGSGTLTTGGDNTNTAFSGVISGTGAMTKVGNGTFVLSGASTYSGATTINGGTLQVDGSLASASTVTVNDTGTLAGVGTVGGSVTLAGSATGATLSSAGTLTIGGTLTVNGAINTLASNSNVNTTGDTINGTLTVNGTLGGTGVTALSNGATLAGFGTVSKPVTAAGNNTIMDVGSLTLGSTLTISGTGNVIPSGSTVNVSGGTTLNPSSSLSVAGTLNSTVALTGGTLASGTTGTIGGAVTAGSGAHVIAPGGIGSVGAMTLQSTLALNNNSTLAFDLQGPTDDSLSISGALSESGGPATIAFTSSGTLPASVTLATFATSSLSTSNFTTSGLPMGYKLVVDLTDIKIVSGPPLGSGTWTNGVGDYEWTTSNNWQTGQPSGAGYVATFDTTAYPGTNGSPVLLGAGGQTVGTIVLNATTSGYTIGGAGDGALALNNDPNSAADAITVNGGSHTIAANVVVAGTFGALLSTTNSGDSLTISGAINNSGTAISVSGPGNTTLSGALGGSGNLTMTGTGILTLGHTNNSYSGVTTVSSGTLRTTADNALGSGALVANATVNLGGNENIGTLSGSGSVSITAGKTLTVTQGIDEALNGSLTLGTTGNGATLALSATNTKKLTLSGSTTLNTGNALAVNGGTLNFNLGNTSTPSVGANVTAMVANGATLELTGTISALADPTALSSGTDTHPTQRVAIQNEGALEVDGGTTMTQATQQVRGIDGAGSVTVADYSSLTADHINQTSLVIGNGSVFTLAPSDSNGNPMASGLVLAGSLAPANSFLASSGSLLGAGSANSTPAVSLGGGVSGASISAVPEPSAIMLALFGCLAVAVARRLTGRSLSLCHADAEQAQRSET